MEAIQIFNYNNNPISFRNENGVIYVNATEMAKSFNKRPNDYLNLQSTKELIQELSITSKNGNFDYQLVITERGSAENGGGTWFHEDLAVDYAQWLSVKFKIWCNNRIKELLKNGAYIAPVEKQMSTLDFLEMQVKLLREQESKVKQLESKVTEIDARTQTRPDYFTIMGYAVLHEIQIGLQMAAKIGAKASRICKNKGIEMESMPDPRFGRVKLYPKSILDEVFNEPINNN